MHGKNIPKETEKKCWILQKSTANLFHPARQSGNVLQSLWSGQGLRDLKI